MLTKKFTMERFLNFSGVVFDLDGVITRTANVHAHAWKATFDLFLKSYNNQAPFDLENDYLKYVDGKPRLDGIRSFLASRDINLPQTLKKKTGLESVEGIAKQKNKLFLEILEKESVDIYDSTVEWIKSLRKQQIKIGLISSSKNCRPIIQRARISHLFDVIIDGTDAEREDIAGKPAPDMFLRAADLLGLNPKQMILVEDAISGVEAGKKGKFALVIGLNRGNQKTALAKNGADLVVSDLSSLNLNRLTPKNALNQMDEIKKLCRTKKPAFFFDYDGTLTPIAPHPSQALLSEEMRTLLNTLSKQYIVAIISGRDRQNVEQHVGISHLFYAGNHGFDIAGPENVSFTLKDVKTYLNAIEKASKILERTIPSIKGAWVEKKKYSIAIHYRKTPENQIEKVKDLIKKISRDFNDLKLTKGKKIFELQPDINWDKGKALKWLLKLFKFNQKNTLPFYFGDDTTDEDAFLALDGVGIGICIQQTAKPTYADYVLDSPKQLSQFLNELKNGN